MDNLAIVDMDVIAYLGIPLTTADGWHLGSFCVIDTEPHVWSDEDIETMQTLAASVTNEIQLRLNSLDKEHMLERLKIRNENLNANSHSVSHKDNYSISAIMGYADLSERYSDRVSFEQMLEYMSTIKELSSYSTTIINALLLLSGIVRLENVA